MITQEELKELFFFDPVVGVFINKTERARNSPAGMIQNCRDKDGYVMLYLKGRLYKAHRMAFLYMTGEMPKDLIDHKNGIVWDNSWNNLREANKSINGINRRKPKSNTSGVKGVHFNKREQKYKAYLTKQGKRFSLGTFENIEDAAQAVALGERKHFEGIKLISD